MLYKVIFVSTFERVTLLAWFTIWIFRKITLLGVLYPPLIQFSQYDEITICRLFPGIYPNTNPNCQNLIGFPYLPGLLCLTMITWFQISNLNSHIWIDHRFKRNKKGQEMQCAPTYSHQMVIPFSFSYERKIETTKQFFLCPFSYWRCSLGDTCQINMMGAALLVCYIACMLPVYDRDLHLW